MIKINDEYYIDADANTYMLKQVHYVKTKEGEEKRQDATIGYYSTVDIALKGYLKHKSREIVNKKEFENISEYLSYIEKLDKELKELKLNI